MQVTELGGGGSVKTDSVGAGKIISGWMREPLVHFLLAGLAVFLFSMLRGEEVDASSRTINIDEAQVSRLSEAFAQTWRRPPTPDEIDGIIRDYIKEEVYYREALRLGLDADDTIIRRRLRSKMETLAVSEIESAVPDDTILQAWLDKYPQRYAQSATISFDQVYIGTDGSRASSILSRIKAGADWREAGEPITLPATLAEADRDSVARTFGTAFADELFALKPGTAWAGPLISGFGAHIVHVRSVKADGKPQLAEVRRKVENDWRATTAKQREAKAYQALLDGYTIKIENP